MDRKVSHAASGGPSAMGDGIFMNLSTGGPLRVHVKDGRIVRMTPLVLTDEDAASWTIEARGHRFTPQRKATVSPFSMGQKSIVYSKDRLLYPMKRVDWDPNGKRNPQNRGMSGYERISWDEAMDLVAAEMNRIKRESGCASVAAKTSSHQFWGNIGYNIHLFGRFSGLFGMCEVTHNPDSWEGWHWGAMHSWGFASKMGIPEQHDLLADALENTELVVFWSSDPEATSGVYGAQECTARRRWLKELGVEMVVIDPYFNHTAALFGDKWMAPRPGTDVCLALAIAWVWITEDSYDREYIESRTVGFEDLKAYILGKDDGIAKTPEWAANESGVPAREIRALARLWAEKRTMLAAGGVGGFGGACRTTNGSEWARLMVCLAAMQGMGKPGSNIWSTQQGAPVDTDFYFPGYAHPVRPENGAVSMLANMPRDFTLQRLILPEAIMEGKAEWWCDGASHGWPEQQFERMVYPKPGHGRVRMLYSFGASFIGTMSETNRYARMYRSDSLECVVTQTVWDEGETRFSDIILPACSNLERWDIGEYANTAGNSSGTFSGVNHRIVCMQHKCIEPLGESRSDYSILAELSERLGFGEYFTDGGKDELDMVKLMYSQSSMPKHMSWEKFFERGYYVVPVPEHRVPHPALRWFAEGRDCDTPGGIPAPRFRLSKGDLQTRSGKIEIRCSTLEDFEKVDPDRPAIPKYIPSWEGHHTAELTAKYPLQMITPHPRFTHHTVGDGKDSFMNDIEEHRICIDGYYYWIVRIHPQDAAVRRIKNRDLVTVKNDRGTVICAAEVTERVAPGVVHAYGSSAVYDPTGRPGESADRGGCVNILTPSRFMTKTSSGMVCNSILVEIEKYRGELG